MIAAHLEKPWGEGPRLSAAALVHQRGVYLDDARRVGLWSYRLDWSSLLARGQF